jgi:hypothetical protein
MQHASDIQTLKDETKSTIGSVDIEPYSSSVYYLRFCLRTTKSNKQLELLRNNLKWRIKEGKAICDAAHEAVILATSESHWNNKPVLERAPCTKKISKYLTPDICLTSTSSKGDLLDCLRGGKIDDVAIMKEVTVKEMTHFLGHAKEINSLIRNRRSLVLDRVVATVLVDDLSGPTSWVSRKTFAKSPSCQ